MHRLVNSTVLCGLLVLPLQAGEAPGMQRSTSCPNLGAAHMPALDPQQPANPNRPIRVNPSEVPVSQPAWHALFTRGITSAFIAPLSTYNLRSRELELAQLQRARETLNNNAVLSAVEKQREHLVLDARGKRMVDESQSCERILQTTDLGAQLLGQGLRSWHLYRPQIGDAYTAGAITSVLMVPYFLEVVREYEQENHPQLKDADTIGKLMNAALGCAFDIEAEKQAHGHGGNVVSNLFDPGYIERLKQDTMFCAYSHKLLYELALPRIGTVLRSRAFHDCCSHLQIPPPTLDALLLDVKLHTLIGHVYALVLPEILVRYHFGVWMPQRAAYWSWNLAKIALVVVIESMLRRIPNQKGDVAVVMSVFIQVAASMFADEEDLLEVRMRLNDVATMIEAGIKRKNYDGFNDYVASVDIAQLVESVFTKGFPGSAFAHAIYIPRHAKRYLFAHPEQYAHGYPMAFKERASLLWEQKLTTLDAVVKIMKANRKLVDQTKNEQRALRDRCLNRSL